MEREKDFTANAQIKRMQESWSFQQIRQEVIQGICLPGVSVFQALSPSIHSHLLLRIDDRGMRTFAVLRHKLASCIIGTILSRISRTTAFAGFEYARLEVERPDENAISQLPDFRHRFISLPSKKFS